MAARWAAWWWQGRQRFGLGVKSDFRNNERVVTSAKDNIPSHGYEVEPIDVDVEDDECSEHKTAEKVHSQHGRSRRVPT